MCVYGFLIKAINKKQKNKVSFLNISNIGRLAKQKTEKKDPRNTINMERK